MGSDLVEQGRSFQHYECEDSWYSCPASEEGCVNDGAGDECNCSQPFVQELTDELERLRAGWDQNDELDSLRNFLGDMSIKMPVGRVIGLVEGLRKSAHEMALHLNDAREENRALREKLEKARDIVALVDAGVLILGIKGNDIKGWPLTEAKQVLRFRVAVKALREIGAAPDSVPEKREGRSDGGG